MTSTSNKADYLCTGGQKHYKQLRSNKVSVADKHDYNDDNLLQIETAIAKSNQVL